MQMTAVWRLRMQHALHLVIILNSHLHLMYLKCLMHILFFPCVSQKVNVFSEIAVYQPVWVNISKLE